MRDVLVIGAGPAGLAAAAMLRAERVPFRIVDREGVIGGAYRRMDPALLMTSPTRLIGLPGLPFTHGQPYPTAQAYGAYLERYARHHALVPERGTVVTVEGGPDHRVTLASGEQLAPSAIVVASGMFEFPYTPAIPGRPTVPTIHAGAWRDGLAVRGQHVLVVGGASSAIEIAELAARRGAVVTVAARAIAIGPATVLGVDPALATLPLLARVSPKRWCDGDVTVPGVDRGFADLRRAGAISVRGPVVELDGTRATLADGTRLDVDLVVFATGYRHAAPFLPPTVARNRVGTVRCRDGRSVSHPGLLFLGSPCARSAASQYLYGIARDAPRVAAHARARARRS